MYFEYTSKEITNHSYSNAILLPLKPFSFLFLKKEIEFARDEDKIEVLNKGLSIAKLYIICKENKKFG